MKKIIPNRVEKGDTIGVIAPSSPITEKKKIDIENSKKLIENLGLKVVLGKNIYSNSLGYSASVKEKVDDLHWMFENKEIKAIFCASGGENSNSLFDYIDYEIIKNNPKIICGFSDSTSILNVITSKTGLVTYHGPTFKSLSTWETLYSLEEWENICMKGNKILGRHDDEVQILREGEVQAELIGGNLSLISQLVCGKYSVDFQDKILFVEDLGIESSPAKISNYIYYMKQNGIFSKIKGLWIGNYEHESGITLEEIILEIMEKETSFPIIKTNNFGHTEKKLTIPIGMDAKIDTKLHSVITLV